MKDLLRLPALFVLFFILLLCMFSGLSLLAQWGQGLSAGREPALVETAWQLPRLLSGALPVSVMAALMLLLFRVANRPASRLLSLVIPLGAAFVLLAFGYQLLHGLPPPPARSGTAAEAQGPPAAAPSLYMLPGVFNQVGDRIVYPESVTGGLLGPTVYAEGLLVGEGGSVGRAAEGGQVLRYYSTGRARATSEGLTMGWPGRGTVQLRAEPVFATLFGPDPALRWLFADLQLLNGELDRALAASLPSFYLTCLALVFCFYAVGMFFRLSRWPLLNALLAILAARGVLLLLRVLRQGVAVELGKIFGITRTLQLAPAMGLLLVGIVLFLLDLLFVPFDRWKGELDNA
jgi:hypothetical protein